MSKRQTRWLAKPFAQLLNQRSPASKTDARHHVDDGQKPETETDFDIIVVGSGYGGAIAASELSKGMDQQGRKPKLAVFERGEEYLSGAFPTQLSEASTHLRASTPAGLKPVGNPKGLFDFRLGAHVSTLVANGVGGGSLINAGVMVEPDAEVFDERWPKALQAKLSLKPFYQEAKQMLGALNQQGVTNSIDLHEQHTKAPLAKFKALENFFSNIQPSFAEEQHFEAAPITVAMQSGKNNAGVQLDACILCGDCATGCNHNAKDSLDKNLLVTAAQQGTEVFAGVTVLYISRDEQSEQWILHCTYTDAAKAKTLSEPVQIRTKQLVLAAGALGSTEILLKSKAQGLALSDRLGQGFSSNGDMLAFSYDQQTRVNAVADEAIIATDRQVGPTISAKLKLRTDFKAGGNTEDEENKAQRILIEEMAVPAALKRLFEEILSNGDMLRQLNNWDNIDKQNHTDAQPSPDPIGIQADKVAHSNVFAVMGDDGAKGRLALKANALDARMDGLLTVDWPELPNLSLFKDQIAVLDALLHPEKQTQSAKNIQLANQENPHSHIIANPAWRALPENMAELMAAEAGPLMTVHPLGGCAMSDSRVSGVVDDLGRVFNPSVDDDRACYDSLLVLDGACIPSALCANPALTISAIALRAVRAMRVNWGYQIDDALQETSSKPLHRPIYQDVLAEFKPRMPTKIAVTERITGEVLLRKTNGKTLDCIVDITLAFDPVATDDMVFDTKRTLQVAKFHHSDEEQAFAQQAPRSKVRIFEKSVHEQLVHSGADDTVENSAYDQAALLVADVEGTLELMKREESTYAGRLFKSGTAWFMQRGLRDIVQGIEQSVSDKFKQGLFTPTASTTSLITQLKLKAKEVTTTAAHAGEIRTFDYRLQMIRPEQGWPSDFSGFHTDVDTLAIEGKKYITYKKLANPLRQFEDMHLHKFPSMVKRDKRADGKPFLRFDSRALMQHKKPLIRIVEQDDQLKALSDVGSFFMLFTRAVINIHLWSFRKPDTAKLRAAQRFPVEIKGVVAPEISEICVAEADVGQALGLPVNVRLTRYKRLASDKPPIVFIHGYSASGNTFTHHSFDENLARFFWKKGRDVWVLDLRTSSAMPTAVLPWSFEDVAFADIPLAIEAVCQKSGADKVDVLAHCMGAAMLSMAVLGEPETCDIHLQAREDLPKRLNKVVLSQVGPRVVFTAENIFRAYGLQYIKQLSPSLFYQFQRSDAENTAEVLLDRLLAAIPYPDREFMRENPLNPFKKNAYVGTRHRMDGLYARTFSLKNMSESMLEHIDDLFGPLNMDTLMQTIYFALNERITDKNGFDAFVTEANLRKRWIFPSLSIHGDENGLSDIATLGRMQQTMDEAERDYQSLVLEGFGHQDSLIGQGAIKNFYKIAEFLDKPQVENVKSEAYASSQRHQLNIGLPELASMVSPCLSEKGKVQVSMHNSHKSEDALAVLYLALSDEALAFSVQSGSLAFNTLNREGSDMVASQLLLAKLSPVAQASFRCLLDVGKLAANWDYLIPILIYDQASLLQVQGIVARNVSDDKTLQVLWQQLLNTLPEAYDEKFKPLQLAALKRGLFDSLRPATQFNTKASTIEPNTSAVKSDENAYRALHFTLASCQYPAGMLDANLAYQSYANMAKWVSADHQGQSEDEKNLPVSLCMLSGDQIYADPSAGLIDAIKPFERYVKPYQQWLARPEVKTLMQQVPVACMLDDHEIIDNWHRGEIADGVDALMQSKPDMKALAQSYQYFLAGKRSYLRYQRPDIHGIAQWSDKQVDNTALFYSFEHQGFHFFMLDSRSEREMRVNHHAEMFSEAQWQALKAWLSSTQDAGRPRFIVSPSMLLPRRLSSLAPSEALFIADKAPLEAALSLESDAWCGYPQTLQKLLRHLLAMKMDDVVFISGDEHISNACRFELKDSQSSLSLLSIHSSALYAPFSFANSHEHQFAKRDSFHLDSDMSAIQDNVKAGLDQQCARVEQVQPKFYPGDGFAAIQVEYIEGNWQVSCDFRKNKEEDQQAPYRFMLSSQYKAPIGLDNEAITEPVLADE